MDSSKQNILQRLKAINNHDKILPYPEVKDDDGIFEKSTEELDVLFAQEFQSNGGNFIYCESKEELVTSLQVLAKQHNWTAVYCWNKNLQQIFDQQLFPYKSTKEELIQSDVGITTCEALIARTGSILLSSQSDSGRSLSIVPPVHIVIATPNQITYSMKEVLSLQSAREGKLPSMLCFTSTNSRTADIEKTLVNGAHGPKQIFVCLLDE
jgi:L-lactate dehydrogenase complex protein LldG